MTRSPLRRKIAALFLATTLVAAWASAAEPSDHGTRGLLARLWNFMTVITLKAGCWIDPNGGQCTVTPDAGCMVDPDGRCVSGS